MLTYLFNELIPIQHTLKTSVIAQLNVCFVSSELKVSEVRHFTRKLDH